MQLIFQEKRFRQRGETDDALDEIHQRDGGRFRGHRDAKKCFLRRRRGCRRRVRRRRSRFCPPFPPPPPRHPKNIITARFIAPRKAPARSRKRRRRRRRRHPSRTFASSFPLDAFCARHRERTTTHVQRHRRRRRHRPRFNPTTKSTHHRAPHTKKSTTHQRGKNERRFLSE